jgi:hypothetical protein
MNILIQRKERIEMFKRGDKVKRIHPDYPGSLVKTGHVYTVRSSDGLHLTLEELDWDHMFLSDAFLEVTDNEPV